MLRRQLKTALKLHEHSQSQISPHFLRSLSISAPSLSQPPTSSRPPTFTTPAEPAPKYLPNDSTKPLPPTDLPVEDYASPLLHTASIFGSVFRYAVFTSVTIVLLGIGGMTGVHLWVEKVELAGPPISESDDRHKWGEEVDGWSGAHRGGGTDPRLGPFARAAIRGAWIAQNWGGGQVASPMAAVGSSPFSAGGAMIGSSAIGSSGSEVGDAGWYLAENYLVFALGKASAKGIALAQPASDPLSHGAGVDRAAVELEQRLAGIRERIGGRFKLEEARDGWERIFYALSASNQPTAWEQREKLRATRKLGEISARLADMWREGSLERSDEKAKAEGWFMGGLLPALAELEGAKLEKNTLDEAKKHISPSSSFFGFWSRSHPPVHSPSTEHKHTQLPSSVRPELATLIHLLDSHSSIVATSSSPLTHSLDPAASRAILNSLVSLETFLARTLSLVSAQALQSASLSFARSLQQLPDFSPPSPSVSPTSTGRSGTEAGGTSLPWTDSRWLASSLAHLFLLTRTSVLATHLAEVSLALRQSEVSSLPLLQGAINDCESVLKTLSTSSLASTLSPLAKFKGVDEARQKCGKGARNIVRDARLTGAMASRLTAFVHERGCGGLAPKKSRGVQTWCGGDPTAEAFYSKALEFATVTAKDEKKKVELEVVDEKGYREAEAGFRRTKKRVLETEKAIK